MWSITYLSTESDKFTRSALHRLLSDSRRKNADLEVTGILLYKNGHFIQMIEGKKKAVHGLFDSICADPRHHSIIEMVSEPITDRKFPDWSMGFRDLDLHGPIVPAGFTDRLNKPWDPWDSDADPLLLRAFIEAVAK